MSCLVSAKILSPDLFIKTQAAFSRLRRAAEIAEQFYGQVACDPRVMREYYQVTTPYGKFAYILSKDPKDGRYYEIVHSRFAENGSLCVPFTWYLKRIKLSFY